MDDIITNLMERFQTDHDLTHLKQDEAFEAFAGFCVLSSYYEGRFAPDTYRMGGGNDLGVDAFGLVINGELLHDATDVRQLVDQAKKLEVSIIVVQAKTTAGFEGKVVADLADNVRHIVNPGPLPYPASSDIENLRECLAAIYENIAKLSGQLPKLVVRYVTTGTQVADLIGKKAATAERLLLASNRFETVEFHCVTSKELRDLYKRATDTVSATIQMPKKIVMPSIPGVRQSLHGLVPASELVRQVLTDAGGNIRKTLFHENLRDFLDYNEVNGEIRATLRDPMARERFAVLNNGVTIVTRELTMVGEEVHIRDFQIVNGCQTCHVLFDEHDVLTDKVQVTVRIVHSQDEDVIGGIVAATNRQTAITGEDLTGRAQFHKDLEAFFEAQPGSRRLYYERRSKQYSSRSEVEKTRVITRQQLTRAYAAMFLGESSGVGHYKALVDARGADLFRSDQLPIAYYTAAATYYRLEWLIRNRKIDARFRPARFHMLAAMKMRLLGTSALPATPKAATPRCERLLSVVWDPNEAEKLVLDLLPPLQRTITTEADLGVPLGEMVRTQRFADRLRREILGRS